MLVNTVFPVFGSVRMMTFGRSGIPCFAQSASTLAQNGSGARVGAGSGGSGAGDSEGCWDDLGFRVRGLRGGEDGSSGRRLGKSSLPVFVGSAEDIGHLLECPQFKTVCPTDENTPTTRLGWCSLWLLLGSVRFLQIALRPTECLPVLVRPV